MKIETKHDIGDILYEVAFSDVIEVKETCVICGGSGEVTIKNSIFDCPNCREGYVYAAKVEPNGKITRSGVVTRIDTYRSRGHDMPDIFYTIEVEDEYGAPTYTTVIREGALFRSIEEAKEAIRVFVTK